MSFSATPYKGLQPEIAFDKKISIEKFQPCNPTKAFFHTLKKELLLSILFNPENFYQHSHKAQDL